MTLHAGSRSMVLAALCAAVLATCSADNSVTEAMLDPLPTRVEFAVSTLRAEDGLSVDTSVTTVTTTTTTTSEVPPATSLPALEELITLGDDFFFGPNDAVLSSTAQARCVEMVSLIVGREGTVLVAGYADSRIGPIPNDKLSEDRAANVRTCILSAAEASQSLPRLVAGGFSDGCPLTANPEDPGNRRVTLWLYSPAHPDPATVEGCPAAS